MATAYHVFGPCIPQVTTGANSAYEVLGVCQNGGRIALDYHQRPVHSDLSGPMVPAEQQQMGETARISLDIIAPDEAVVEKVRARSAGSVTAGAPGTPGTLLGTTANCAFTLYLPSSIVNPWRFTTCVLEKDDVKEGTEAEPLRLTFFAWRFIAGSANTVANTTLYTRS